MGIDGSRAWIWRLVMGSGLVLGSGLGLGAATAPAQVGSPQEMVATLIVHERDATEHKGLYAYLSKERSERTGGHLWTEKVVETRVGKVRMLLAEDGVPLSAERNGRERGRLAAIVADPESFGKKEQALKNDEQKAKQMLELLPRAFLFEHARMEGQYERIDYRPNPMYEPRNLEERVLHEMLGSMLVDPKAVRLRELDGHLPKDVSIGFGLLATIREGSRFQTERGGLPSGEWKTTLIDTDITGRAIFFKAISKRQHSEHSNFQELAGTTSVVQAVAIAEQ